MREMDTAEGRIHGFGPDDLLDKPVYDLNGHRLGRVRLCREVADEVVSFDVELAPRVREAFHLVDASAHLSPDDVIAADDTITLREEGAVLLHPEAFRREALDAGEGS